MRLFLVDEAAKQRIDLGPYKFNDVPNCINAAKRRHKFLDRLEANSTHFEGVTEPGPLRRDAPKTVPFEQLAII